MLGRLVKRSVQVVLDVIIMIAMLGTFWYVVNVLEDILHGF